MSVENQVERIQENLSPIVSVETKQDEKNSIKTTTEASATIADYEIDEFNRIVTVGDLPDNHDTSLVLKKGRSITVQMRHRIMSEASLENSNDPSIYGRCRSRVKKDVYDDSGKTILISENAIINCIYKTSYEENIMKINITAIQMGINPGVYVVFSTPPRCEGARGITAEEIEQLRDELFTTPTIGTDLIFGVEPEDRTSDNNRVKFGVNDSGDRTVVVSRGYSVNLVVGKDILFSGPYVPRGSRPDMWW